MIVTLLGVWVFLLAFAGLFALLMMHRIRRTLELSVRLALGAWQSSVQRLFSSEALRLVGFGSVVAILAAWLLGRVAHALLFNVDSPDIATIGVTIVIFGVVALVATILPVARVT